SSGLRGIRWRDSATYAGDFIRRAAFVTAASARNGNFERVCSGSEPDRVRAIRTRNAVLWHLPWAVGRCQSNPAPILRSPAMTINQPGDGTRLQALAGTVREHRMRFLVEGIVLLALGFLAILIPPLATLGVTILFGWLFLISGIIGLVATFYARQAPGCWWSLISAVLGIGAGLILLVNPGSGAVSLTLILVVFFVIEGVASVMYALEHR